MKLNLGSWVHPLPSYINVDIRPWFGVDVVTDLNLLPWPWKGESADEIRAVDIVEHLGKLTKVEIVEELARITKRGGLVIIRVPCEKHHWAWSSLQHAHAFNYNSFEESYAQPWFKVEKITVRFSDEGKDFALNRLTRQLCKIGVVFTMTFYLTKISKEQRTKRCT
jgi:predicted SAM-dependent methyltransferase